jgi:putative phosphonate transport system ATP-binding protein
VRVEQRTARGPRLHVNGISKSYGRQIGCVDISLSVRAGEIVGIVGESGSGKSTLLHCLSGQLVPDSGSIVYHSKDAGPVDLLTLPEVQRRRIARDEWGVIRQESRDGLRLDITAGGNIGERLMAVGACHYGQIRSDVLEWLAKVEIDASRVDDKAKTYSGGMRQRLQIAANLISKPRIVLMDEPTGGLDVSVQASLIDLIRRLVHEQGVAAIIVTHDLGVVRLLADRVLVMQRGRVIEQGLADQILDDPQHPYTQLLVSSILQV